MEIIPLHIKDAFIFRIQKHHDHRGHLAELFNMNTYPSDVLPHFPVRQVTWTVNNKNALRGLHISAYAKLLTCVKGSLYDVIVDMRPQSDSYLQWAGVTLNETNGLQLYVPPNCGHGYLALEEGATIIYCQGDCFDSAIPEGLVSVYDPLISIKWPLNAPHEKALLSKKDACAVNLCLADIKIQPHRKRILIIGSSGQVGRCLFHMFKNLSEKYIVFGTTFTHHKPQHLQFDLKTVADDPMNVHLLLDACCPHVVIICAAMTNVNLCESEPTMTKKTNVESVKQIVRIGKERGMKTIFFSSDYIFNAPNLQKGEQDEINMLIQSTGHKEDAQENPQNMYGISKLEAEKAALALDPEVLIIRTSRIYGPEELEKNFVYQIVQNLSAGKKMELLTDEISCPTYNQDLCNGVLLLMKKCCSGIFHIVGPQAYSKYKWGLKIANYFNLNNELLIPKTLDELRLPAKRGKFIALSTEKFRNEFPDFKFHSLEDALKDWKEQSVQNIVTFPSVL